MAGLFLIFLADPWARAPLSRLKLWASEAMARSCALSSRKIYAPMDARSRAHLTVINHGVMNHRPVFQLLSVHSLALAQGVPF